MGDLVAQSNKPVRVGSGPKARKFTAAPTTITIREPDVDGKGYKDGVPIANKWIYILDEKGAVLVEIFAEKGDLWHVDYRPPTKPAPLSKFDRTTPATVVVKKPVLEEGQYRVFLSPVRAGEKCRQFLKDNAQEIPRLVKSEHVVDGVPVAHVFDFYVLVEFLHRVQYMPALADWEKYVQNEDRQARLFIASVVDNWMADGDPADVADTLKDSREPRRIIDEYTTDEKKKRVWAERNMQVLGDMITAKAHEAIDVAAQENGPEGLAVGLLHWGIISQAMLCVAPGRVLAKKLFEEDVAFVSRVLFGDSTNPDLPTAYATYKKAHAAAVGAMIELLAAKIRALKAAAGASRTPLEKVRVYLQTLGLETELKGNYKLISERLESGQRITRKLKGPKRARVITSTQKLIRKAGAAIPDYDAQATKLLDTAERLEVKKPGIELTAASVQVILDLVSLISAIEEFRNAFPDSKDEKLIGIVGAGGDFYSAAAALVETFSQRARFMGITGGAAGFVSGVVDMLDAEEKMVRAAMNNNDYAAAVGHGITAVGASMTALAAGVLCAKAVSGGAVFGGPFGAIVAAIGAGLMALGMLIVAYFSDNDYQSFSRHCFLGEDHGESVTPDWSTVSFGGGSLKNEVTALYDLLYRFKVSLVETVKVTRGLPNDTYDFSGLRLTISPGYAETATSEFEVNLSVSPGTRRLEGTFDFKVKDLKLPDAETGTSTDDKTKLTSLVRRWSGAEMWGVSDASFLEIKRRFPIVEHLHLYDTDFTLEVQLIESGRALGKPVRMKGSMGGKKKFGNVDLQEWNRVVFDY